MSTTSFHLCSPNPSSGYGSAEEDQLLTCESVKPQKLKFKIKVPANLSLDTHLLPSRSWPTSPDPLSLTQNVFITPSPTTDSHNPLQLSDNEYQDDNSNHESLGKVSQEICGLNCGRSASWQGPSNWSNFTTEFPARGDNLLSTLLTTRLETKFLSEVEKHRVKKPKRHQSDKSVINKTIKIVKQKSIDISDHQYSSSHSVTSPKHLALKRHFAGPTISPLQPSSNPPSILESLLLTQEPLHANKGSDFFVEQYLRCSESNSRLKLCRRDSVTDLATDIFFDSDFIMNELPLDFEGVFGKSLSPVRVSQDTENIINVPDDDEISILQSWIPSFIDDMKFCQELEEIFLEQTQESDPWLQPLDNL